MRVFLFLILLVTSSCSAIGNHLISNFPDCNLFFERFPENKKSIVIFKFYDVDRNALWCKAKDDELLNQEINFCVNFAYANNNEAVMLEPGEYYLFNSSKNYKGKKYIHNIDKKYLSMDKNNIHFEVKSSEIVYVGAMYRKSGYAKFYDEFSEIQKMLKDKNYDLLEKIFSNKRPELSWLILQYQKTPGLFIKKIALIKAKKLSKYSNKTFEKHALKIISKGDKADLDKLAKSIEEINHLLDMEKQKNRVRDAQK